MIAKLITYAENRDEAIDLMRKALSDYKVLNNDNIGGWPP